MKLDPDKAHRISAAVRGLIVAMVAGAIAFGASEAKATAAGAIATALITLGSAMFVRSALPPRETPSEEGVTEPELDDPEALPQGE
jgi:hypothetical protein